MSYRKSPGGGLSPAARITQEIITRLESGTRPWIKPWRGVPTSRPLRACGIPYRGMNVFWLWMVSDMCGFQSPFWMTYNQAKGLGAQVRKGEKSTIAIFYKSYTKEVEAPDTGEKSDEARRVLKSYPVFNADQVEGLPERFHPAPMLDLVEPQGREQELDAFFATIPAQLRHHGDEAYYEPVIDRVTMPPSHLFSGFDHYYATLGHELSHWSGHASRLGRDLKNRFGTAAYAAEELVAELSSAMLGAELGLPVAHLDSHASYIEHWLKLLKADDRAILTAAAKADEACSLLLKLGAGRPPTRTTKCAAMPRSRLEEAAMGRVVSYPSGAIVAFTVMEVEEGDDWDFEYEWVRDDLRERAAHAFPSLASHDGWRGREDRILMRNVFADFGVSVYGELVAVWIAERDDGAYRDAEWRTARSPRAQHWLEQIATRFDRVFGDYDCLGRFSNGEAIYRKRGD